MGRAEDFETIVDLIGGDSAQNVTTGDGWPGLAKIRVLEKWIDVSIFAAPVNLSKRDRDASERRFQNPGQNRPIVVPPGTTPLLVGLWISDQLVAVEHPVLVLADPIRRLERITRYSVFLHLESLRTAERQGWCQRENSTDEMLQYLRPEYLPAITGAIAIDGRLRAQAADAFLGPVDIPEPTTEERLYAITRRVVRSSQFARDVRDAYGSRCAMCGLGLSLGEAAHILQVASEGPDEIANGVYLCRNHHAAFDRHIIWVDPDSRAVVFDITQVETDQDGDGSFISSTFSHLAEPVDRTNRPGAQFFKRRYSSSDGAYDWVERMD